ncbi:MAG: hypothetical protein ISS02_00785 [Candidatus Portnoybacteria bacterium]|nr:hypothetical protein [Candidatus Portnoybacteria bacterium]
MKHISFIKYFVIIGLGFLALPIIASSNLVAYWDFDDINGWEALDSSGNELHAYIGRALSGVEGKKDFSLLFDGINSYTSVNDDPLLDFGIDDSFSISAWIKMNNDIKDWRVIVGKANNNSLNGYMLRHSQNGNLSMTVEESDGSYQSDSIASQDYRDGKWHHVVGIIDRQNKTNTIYVDGYKKDESNIDSLGSLVNDDNLNIGSLQQSGGISFYGLIDEVMIYNKVLSLSEIHELYGEQVYVYPHGSLLQPYNSYKVYYINSKGEKDWIINEEVFNSFNNKWEDVIRVDSWVLEQYPTQVKYD